MTVNHPQVTPLQPSYPKDTLRFQSGQHCVMLYWTLRSLHPTYFCKTHQKVQSNWRDSHHYGIKQAEIVSGHSSTFPPSFKIPQRILIFIRNNQTSEKLTVRFSLLQETFVQQKKHFWLVFQQSGSWHHQHKARSPKTFCTTAVKWDFLEELILIALL